jgi:predicted nucleotidyltransferase
MELRTMPPPQASARKTEMGDTFNRVLFSALDALQDRQIPYALIGGIAASGLGRPRSTHDIDVFVRPEDAESALEALDRGGFEVERTDPRWLFKGWKESMMVDVIFKSSGDIYFDDEMSKRAKLIHYHGRDIPAVSPEDLIIIKCAVHSEIGPHHWHDALAILSHASLDWQYLLRRGRRATRRLLALLIYAQSNDIWIPNSIIQHLFASVFDQTQQKQSPLQNPFDREVRTHSAATQAATNASTNGSTRTSQTLDSTRSNSSQGQARDLYFVGHIHEALAADVRTAHLDCDVEIGSNRIIIRGEALTPDQRLAIEEVIHGFAPAFEIENQLRVFEMSAPAVEEML